MALSPAGDFADLKALVALRQIYKFLLVIDEAHATLVCGDRYARLVTCHILAQWAPPFFRIHWSCIGHTGKQYILLYMVHYVYLCKVCCLHVENRLNASDLLRLLSWEYLAIMHALALAAQHPWPCHCRQCQRWPVTISLQGAGNIAASTSAD